MTDKGAVLTIEPRACIEKIDSGWQVCRSRSTAAKVLGAGTTPSRAWHEARMRLFAESIGGIISEIPVVEKGV